MIIVTPPGNDGFQDGAAQLFSRLSVPIRNSTNFNYFCCEKQLLFSLKSYSVINPGHVSVK